MSGVKRYRWRIGGQAVDPQGGTGFETQNPYSGQTWAEMTATQRGVRMRRLADLIARDAARPVSVILFKDEADALRIENGIDAVRDHLQTQSVWINSGAVAGNPLVLR